MHDLDVHADLLRRKQRVGLGLRGAEHDGLSETAIDQEDVGERLHPVVEGAVDGDVSDVFLCLVLQVLGEVDRLPVGPQVCVRQGANPRGHGGGEEQELRRR